MLIPGSCKSQIGAYRIVTVEKTSSKEGSTNKEPRAESKKEGLATGQGPHKYRELFSLVGAGRANSAAEVPAHRAVRAALRDVVELRFVFLLVAVLFVDSRELVVGRLHLALSSVDDSRESW